MFSKKAEAAMTDEELLREIDSLPLEAQRQIEEFIFFLR